MQICVFRDGSERVITGEQGKYWLTGCERVRKLSRSIVDILEVPDPAPEAELTAEAQEEMQKKPAKKKSRRKKKEDTEEKRDGERGE